jgi:hypothetical protein
MEARTGKGWQRITLKAAVDFLAAPYRYVVSDGFSREVAEANTIVGGISL